MKILNFGSLNLDYVYEVDHHVKSKETISSISRQVFCGGKGLNQSIALSKAGLDVYHAGFLGNDGIILLDELKKYNVNVEYITSIDAPSGHAIIQVDGKGENCILLYGGTNQMMTSNYIDEVLSHFDEGDYLVLQNEVNLLDEMIEKAYQKGMKIVLNPSPFNEKVFVCDLNKVSLLFINEVEGYQMTGKENPQDILENIHIPVVLTLGENGAYYKDENGSLFQDIFKTEVVDTTAAGDTFTGYFLASILNGKDEKEALKIAAYASSITVSKKGAAASIPSIDMIM